MGCRYIQVDAPDFGQLVDPAQRDAWEQAGISVDRVFSEGVDMLNEVAGVSGVSFGLHLCRGNYDSDWISTGTYETISKQLFQRATNYDTFLLEYDDERSGSFSALGDVPDDKVVVLGLVSTKFDRMEPADQLAARISEASGFFPREQLALSTQCGFASAGPGNQISENAQENKLRLVGEVADRVLGVARRPGLLLFGPPPAVEVGELVLHLRGQVVGFEPAGEADGLAHLREVLGAVRAARQVRLEAAPGPGVQRALEVVGDQLDGDRARHGDRADRGQGSVRGHAELVDDSVAAGLHVQEPAAGRGRRVHRPRIGGGVGEQAQLPACRRGEARLGPGRVAGPDLVTLAGFRGRCPDKRYRPDRGGDHDD